MVCTPWACSPSPARLFDEPGRPFARAPLFSGFPPPAFGRAYTTSRSDTHARPLARPRRSLGILHENEFCSFVQKIWAVSAGEFCTKKSFAFLCRRFGRFLLANSARKRVLRFCAEDLGGFCWRILHENEFCSFVQKKYAILKEKVCINCDFLILCRNQLGLRQKTSAKFSIFRFRAEISPNFGEKRLHKIHFSHFVQNST